MAEPIEIPFGLWTLVNPRNYLLDGDGVQIPHGRGTFEGVTSGFSPKPPKMAVYIGRH